MSIITKSAIILFSGDYPFSGSVSCLKRENIIKTISFFAAACLIFTAYSPSGIGSVNAQPTLEAQRDELQAKLDEAEKKLAELGKKSRDTEAYINALGDKISYLTEQYNLSKQEAAETEAKIASTEKAIAINKAEISSAADEAKALESELKNLNVQFQSVYDEYCARMRAIYISGSQGSVLTFLITSDGLESFLTRLQMISAVAKRDGELLEKVQTQSEKITQTQKELGEKTKALKASQKELKSNRQQLKLQREALLKSQEELAQQQAVIETQQETQNRILLDLHKKTKKYGEFRDITKEEIDAIDADIAAADARFKAAHETTAQQTTAKAPATTTAATQSASRSAISLTYPCPAYTAITCAFGAYAGHTGCDFSTDGNVNQKIVAAESGTVILVKILEYSYGHYIVIYHDKKTASGKDVYTLYAHNNNIIVSEGQYVKKGQQIAFSGTTGNSTGPHCHFEVRVGGSGQSYAQNPANYLP